MRRFQRAIVSALVGWLVLAGTTLAAPIRVTTWNLEWFPNGSAKELPAAEQEKRIAAAADVLRPLKSDIILLQEVRDWDVCSRLAEAIQPGVYQVAVVSAFREGNAPGVGKQQVGILAKEPAQAAWSESWKSMEGIDPPRGFVFAWFKIAGHDVGVYSLHLKSNLIMRGNKAAEAQKNIRKREVAIDQLLNHVRDVIAPSMPNVKSIVIGGDFNTNLDQPDFAAEKTLLKLTDAGFHSAVEGAPLLQRITHPGSGPYPDATFDYLFGSNLVPAHTQITASQASDHYPVTCDFSLGGSDPKSRTPPAVTTHSPAPPPAVTTHSPTPPPAVTTHSPTLPAASTSTPQFVTLTQPVPIKITYGETVLPRGLKLTVLSRNGENVTVKYLEETLTIPVKATDLQ